MAGMARYRYSRERPCWGYCGVVCYARAVLVSMYVGTVRLSETAADVSPLIRRCQPAGRRWSMVRLSKDFWGIWKHVTLIGNGEWECRNGCDIPEKTEQADSSPCPLQDASPVSRSSYIIRTRWTLSTGKSRTSSNPSEIGDGGWPVGANQAYALGFTVARLV